MLLIAGFSENDPYVRRKATLDLLLGRQFAQMFPRQRPILIVPMVQQYTLYTNN